MLALLFTLLISSNVQAQTDAPTDTSNPVQPPILGSPVNSTRTRFNNQISMGYIPEVNKASVSFSYFTRDFEQSINILTTKIADYTSSQARMTLSGTYRISEKNLIGLSLNQLASGTSNTKYTTIAKNAGFTDSNNSASGLSEPSFKLSRIIKESDSTRILASFGIDIPMGASKSGDAKAGGGSYSLGFDMVKASDSAEFGLSLSYTGTDKLKSELSSGTTVTTTGRGFISLSAMGNLYLSNDSSFAVGYFRNQNAKETSSYSSGSQDFVTDAYSSNGFLVGFIFKFDEEISISAALSTSKTDAVDSIQGTTTVTSNEGTSKVLGVGLTGVF